MKPVKLCTNCSTPLNNDKGFCPNCGHPVDVSDTATVQSQTTSYGNNPYAGNPYGNQPYIPPPPYTQQSPRKGPGAVWIVIVTVIAILAIVGGIQGALHSGVSQSNVTATNTATVASTQTTVNPYTNGGTLVLNDPLQDNSLGNGWVEKTYSFGNCSFTGGTYHVIGLSTTEGIHCAASPDFSNFAFEVQMTIIKGDNGGVDFRLDSTQNTKYIFFVGTDGSFALDRGQGLINQVLFNSTSSSAIHSGLGQTNIIAVVAQGSKITLYINGKLVASVTDNTYTHGQIALLAAPYRTNGHQTEVAYSNAKVWSL